MNLSPLCRSYLTIVYSQCQVKPSSGNKLYGEILFPSVEKVISLISPRAEDVFYDLGSGLGKIATQLFLQTQIQKSVGIELNESLHHQAIEILERIKNELPLFFDDKRNLSFISGDFLEENFEDASLLFINSTFFDQPLLVKLSEKINTLENVRLVMSSRPLPNLKLPLSKITLAECSWDTSLCYFYRKNERG